MARNTNLPVILGCYDKADKVAMWMKPKNMSGRKPSEQYKEEVYADLLVGRTRAIGSLRSYTDKYPHKYAIDLSAKEYWEYFDLERVSPREHVKTQGFYCCGNIGPGDQEGEHNESR